MYVCTYVCMHVCMYVVQITPQNTSNKRKSMSVASLRTLLEGKQSMCMYYIVISECRLFTVGILTHRNPDVNVELQVLMLQICLFCSILTERGLCSEGRKDVLIKRLKMYEPLENTLRRRCL